MLYDLLIVIVMIQMSQGQSFEGSRVVIINKQNRELINQLKSIISQQEFKITQLQTDLRKWQRRYKEQFFKQAYNNDRKYLDRIKEQEEQIQTFTKDIASIQNKYQNKQSQGNHISQSDVLHEAVTIIGKLYEKVHSFEKELTVKNSLIQEQEDQIQIVKQRMEQYRREYEVLKSNSEGFEEKALAEIKRQEEIIRKLRQ